MELESEIEELINRRRRQILIHSCIYYRFGTSIISDKQFDSWSYELVALQQTYPDIASKCINHHDFKGFDGTTGFDLPSYGWVASKAEYILKISQNKEDKNV